MNIQSYYIILPFNEKMIQPGASRGISYLMLPNREGEGRDRQRVGVPITTNKHIAMEFARQQAMENRDTPIVARIIAFVELPKNLTFVEKYFTKDGEVVSEDTNE